MEITLFKNYSAFNRLDKDLRDPITYSNVIIKGDLSHESPVLLLTRGDNDYFVGYNFLYCKELDAYYNARITLKAGNLVEITCNVDPSSFKEAIRGLTAFIERQEYVYNPYMNDSLTPIAQGSIIETIDAGTVGQTSDTRSLYITCIGTGDEPDE